MESLLYIKETKQTVTFPCLARLRGGRPDVTSPDYARLRRGRPDVTSPDYVGEVILFTSENTGVVVYKQRVDVGHDLGHFNTKWISVDNSAIWEILPAGSSVTILA